jgi:hypothetical protein
VTYSSDRMSKRMFFDVPDKYDSQADALDMALVNLADVNIAVSNGMSENLFGRGSQAHGGTRQGRRSGQQAAMKNNVRFIEIGNNLYPTP